MAYINQIVVDGVTYDVEAKALDSTLDATVLKKTNLVNGFTQTTPGVNSLDAAAGKTLNDGLALTDAHLDTLMIQTPHSSYVEFMEGVRLRMQTLGIRVFAGTMYGYNPSSTNYAGMAVFNSDYSGGYVLRVAYANTNFIKYRYSNGTWETDIYPTKADLTNIVKVTTASATVSVAPGEAVASATLSFTTPSGYTAIGVVGWSIGGTGSTQTTIYAAFLNSTRTAVAYKYRNTGTGSSAVSQTHEFRVLFINSDYFSA